MAACFGACLQAVILDGLSEHIPNRAVPGDRVVKGELRLLSVCKNSQFKTCPILLQTDFAGIE